jgi:hypothetical protein
LAQRRPVAVGRRLDASQQCGRERVEAEALHGGVEPAEQHGRAVVAVVRHAAQQVAHLPHAAAGGAVVAADVADDDQRRAARGDEGVVPVTADLRLLRGRAGSARRSAGRARAAGR